MCKKPAFENMNKDNYSFYNSRSWRKLSKNYKLKHPLCVHCKERGIVTPSQVTDHKRPIDKGGAKWDSSNFQALCHRCHNKKTAASKKA
jgi:5-methylcytosine-specific restriction protein A